MEEHNTIQAAENAQPEMSIPQSERQPEPTRFERGWDTVSTFIDRRSVRVAAETTAALIVLGLGVMGYRHHRCLYENQEE